MVIMVITVAMAMVMVMVIGLVMAIGGGSSAVGRPVACDNGPIQHALRARRYRTFSKPPHILEATAHGGPVPATMNPVSSGSVRHAHFVSVAFSCSQRDYPALPA